MSDERPTFGKKALASINKRLDGPDAAPQMGPPDELVAFTVFIPRDLYLELLERHYHEKGFVIQQAVAAGIRRELAALGTPRLPLPPARLGKLLQTNKKLRKP